jgi:peptidylprolyl isomerase
MARTSVPDSADCQFFIMLDAARSLDGQYTVWGRVTSGMDFVDAIKKGDSFANGLVKDPDQIVRMRVAVDVAE